MINTIKNYKITYSKRVQEIKKEINRLKEPEKKFHFEDPLKNLYNSDKIVCFGDIHGQLEQIQDLVEKVYKHLGKNLEFYHFVFLGDYVDRGTKVKETLDYLIKLKEQRKGKVHFIMGNHDWAFGHFLGLWKEPERESYKCTWEGYSQTRELWIGENGEENSIHLQGLRYCSRYEAYHTFKSYGCKFEDRNQLIKNVPKEHKEFIRDLPFYLETKDYVFVHAGLEYHLDMKEQLKELDLKDHMIPRVNQICNRQFLKDYPENFKIIVSGHVQVKNVQIEKRRIMVDTSGGRGLNPISAFILDQRFTIESKIPTITNQKKQKSFFFF